MPEQVLPVEAQALPAGGEQVVDYEALYKTQQDRLAKAEEAARNYKTAALKYKKAAKDEPAGAEITDQVELFRQIAREEQANSTVEQERKSLEDLNLKMARELREAKLALANKATSTPASQASGASDLKPADNTFSPEKLAALKARGWDDKKIEMFKKNLSKASA